LSCYEQTEFLYSRKDLEQPDIQRAHFLLPYPRDNWRERLRWNDGLLEMMQCAWHTYAVFNKTPSAWNEDDQTLVRWLNRELKQYG
jgi:hypothetical protein